MIKKLLPLFLFLTLFFKVQSQDYVPMVVEGITWDVGHIGMGYMCEFSANPERYFFSGDTVFNGTVYHTMFAYNSTSTTGWNPPYCSPFLLDTVPSFTEIYIREDTNAQKVYRYYPGLSNQESLLFDFSIGVGDTIPIDGLLMVVDSIWTITTPDGINRRVYQSDWGYPDPIMIEGIGGNCGPFYQPFIWFENYAKLMCAKNNGLNIYGDECNDMLTVSTPTLPLRQLTCYPNPVRDYVTIELPNGTSTYEVTMINSLGKFVEKSTVSANTLKLDLSAQKPGVYFIKVVGGRETYITRIIKD